MPRFPIVRPAALGPSLRVAAAALALALSGPAAATTIHLFGEVETEDNVLQRALAAASAGDLDRAEALLGPVLATRPDTAAAQEINGVILARRGAIEDAITAFERAVEINPGQSSAVTKLGDIYTAIDAPAMARRHYERALAINPDDRQAHQRLGLIHEEAGDIERAIGHYEAGLAGTPPDYVGIKVNLALLYNRVGAHDRARDLLAPHAEAGSGSALLHRALANAHLGRGDHAAAMAGYRRALDLAPEDELSTIGLGVAQLEGGDAKAAVATLETVNRARPTDGSAAVALARAYRMLGDDDRARAVLEAAHPDDGPADPEVYLRLGEIQQAGGDLDMAAATFRAMAAAYPEQPSAYLALGALLGFQRDYEAALEVFSTGLEVSPGNPALMRGSLRSLQQLGRVEAALAQARALVASGTASPQDAFLLGALEEAGGTLGGAAQAYRKAIDAAPEFWPALNNLASVLTRDGSAAEAVPLAETAHDLAPDNAAVTHTLGWARFKAGDATGADALLAAAAAQSPETPLYHAHLAEVRAALGNREDARQALARARAAGLDPVEAENIEERLRLR